MSRQQQRALNLDELFGKHKQLVVLWGGKRHVIKHPSEMGPEDLYRIQRLQEGQNLLANSDGEVDGAVMEELMDEVIKTIAPTLAPLGLPFLAKMRVMNFYQDELEGDSDPKATAGGSGLTGETSTAP